MDVDITTQPGFAAGKPRMLFVLFEGHYELSPIQGADYDVSPDGHRFLMLKADQTQVAPTQINVVLNCSGLKSRSRKFPQGRSDASQRRHREHLRQCGPH
jgi:hypothetical protein